MKKTELLRIIREETKKALNEGTKILSQVRVPDPADPRESIITVVCVADGKAKGTFSGKASTNIARVAACKCAAERLTNPNLDDRCSAKINEEEQTIENKVAQIVNAWGSYKIKDDIKSLIKILKYWKVPKPAAVQIIKAEAQDEVISIVKSL